MRTQAQIEQDIAEKLTSEGWYKDGPGHAGITRWGRKAGERILVDVSYGRAQVYTLAYDENSHTISKLAEVVKRP